MRDHDLHLVVSVYPVGWTGRVAVWVRLAMPRQNYESTRPESQHVAEVELITSYEAIGRFARDLPHILRGEAEVARIDGW